MSVLVRPQADLLTPILAVIGIVLYLSAKSSRKGFRRQSCPALPRWMFGMATMSGAVSGLQ